MGRNIGLPTNGGVKVDIVPKQFSLIFKKFISFFFFFKILFWGLVGGGWGGRDVITFEKKAELKRN